MIFCDKIKFKSQSIRGGGAKGFTLVELLAVIVILAILVIIAVPSVIKMLNNTKKNAFSVEAENIIKSAKNAYSNRELNGESKKYCYTLNELSEYVDKDFTGYTGSVYIDPSTDTYKIWLSKDDFIINGSNSGDINVVELTQLQPASVTCEDIVILACSNEPPTYTLAIDPNGGTHDAHTTVETYELERNGTKGINDPYKIGYAFDGWETISGTITSFTSRLLTMGNTDVELRAKWKRLYSYTGTYSFSDDGNGNWHLKLLTSGTLVFNTTVAADVFLVGGGGGGGGIGNSRGGGGGGYTLTLTNIEIEKDNSKEVIIGAGGESNTDGESTTFADVSVDGGHTGNPNNGTGGAGGSGGGAGGGGSTPATGTGGSNGSNGGNGSWNVGAVSIGGAGQGTNIGTREFGEVDGTLYAGGGGGATGSGGAAPSVGGAGGGGDGANERVGYDGETNTGGGGGSGGYNYAGGTGGSGIVVIRNHRT